MTDRDRLRALLTDFGVYFIETEPEEHWAGKLSNPPWPRPENPDIDPAEIRIPADGSPKNDGYGGFYCAFKFDGDGTFIEVEVAE